MQFRLQSNSFLPEPYSGELLVKIGITKFLPDVIEYPDSDKVGVMAGSAPGGMKEKRLLKKFYKANMDVSYWDGED